MGAMLPTPGDGDRPAVRISDADRERVVETLRRHTAEGRLTLDEFAERVGTVFDARTEHELEVVLSDLPVDQPALPTPAEKESRRRRAVRWTVGVMGAGDQKGRWRVEGETNAVAFMGGVCLDLRQAEIEGPEVVITAVAFMGGIDVIVPDGVEVVMTGFAFMGGRDNRVRGNPLPGTPLIRVRGFAFMGGITVRTRKPRAERKAERDRDRERRREQIERGVHGRVERELDRAQRHVDRELARAERHLRRGGRFANPGMPTPPVPPMPPMPGLWPLPGDHEDEDESIDDLVEGTSERLESQAAPDGTVTILITDIEGSSRMAESLGDNRWIEVLRRHNEIVRRCVVNHGGTVVKSQGDGFMVAFQSARRAVLCAISIQRAMEDYRKAHPEEDLRLRIGLHTGEVIREADDVFGRNVIMAARIASEAQGDEILVSSLVKELTDSGGDLGFDGEREVELKGLTRPCCVYTVAW
jgi:class 3 adenylate cyclase